MIEETARRAAVPARSPKTSESSEVSLEKKRLNRYSENSDGGSSDSSGFDVRQITFNSCLSTVMIMGGLLVTIRAC